MRAVALTLTLLGPALSVPLEARAQDSALVRYATDLQHADHLLPSNRRDYFETGARLTSWVRALEAIAPPPALANAHSRLVSYSRVYAREQVRSPLAPSSGIDACVEGRAYPDQTCGRGVPETEEGQATFDRASNAQRGYLIVLREIARHLQAAYVTVPPSWLKPPLN